MDHTLLELRQQREKLQKKKEAFVKCAMNIQKNMSLVDCELDRVEGEIKSQEEFYFGRFPKGALYFPATPPEEEDKAMEESEGGEAGFEEEGIPLLGVPEMNSAMQWRDRPEDESAARWLDNSMAKRRHSEEEEVVGGEEFVVEEAAEEEDKAMEELRRELASDEEEEEEQAAERAASQSDLEEGEEAVEEEAVEEEETVEEEEAVEEAVEEEENQQEEIQFDPGGNQMEDPPEEEELPPWRKTAGDGRTPGWKSRKHREDVTEEGQEQTEEMRCAMKWLLQNGRDDHREIPQKFTPCKYHFKSRSCQNAKCLFSHNEEIFGREPFASVFYDWRWDRKDRKTWDEINRDHWKKP